MAVMQKGAISFGLVYIPVELYTAVQSNDIRFNQLSMETKNRVKYKKIDSQTGKELASDDIVKGYEYGKGQYVIVTDEDFAKIKSEPDRSIDILLVTDGCGISPAYYDKSYYMIPQKGGEKAFTLFRQALREQNRVAVGKTMMGEKETMLAIAPADDAMLLSTLFYAEEIKDLPKVGAQPQLSAQELDLAKQLLKSLEGPFEPEKYQDEYQKKLKELIDGKIQGKEIVTEKTRKPPQIGNLLDALKASLEMPATKNKKATSREKA